MISNILTAYQAASDIVLPVEYQTTLPHFEQMISHKSPNYSSPRRNLSMLQLIIGITPPHACFIISGKYMQYARTREQGVMLTSPRLFHITNYAGWRNDISAQFRRR
jgi:hypothetical protein